MWSALTAVDVAISAVVICLDARQAVQHHLCLVQPALLALSSFLSHASTSHSRLIGACEGW